MTCLECGQRLGLMQRLKGDKFCSAAHARAYKEVMDREMIRRLRGVKEAAEAAPEILQPAPVAPPPPPDPNPSEFLPWIPVVPADIDAASVMPPELAPDFVPARPRLPVVEASNPAVPAASSVDGGLTLEPRPAEISTGAIELTPLEVKLEIQLPRGDSDLDHEAREHQVLAEQPETQSTQIAETQHRDSGAQHYEAPPHDGTRYESQATAAATPPRRAGASSRSGRTSWAPPFFDAVVRYPTMLVSPRNMPPSFAVFRPPANPQQQHWDAPAQAFAEAAGSQLVWGEPNPRQQALPEPLPGQASGQPSGQPWSEPPWPGPIWAAPPYPEQAALEYARSEAPGHLPSDPPPVAPRLLIAQHPQPHADFWPPARIALDRFFRFANNSDAFSPGWRTELPQGEMTSPVDRPSSAAPVFSLSGESPVNTDLPAEAVRPRLALLPGAGLREQRVPVLIPPRRPERRPAMLRYQPAKLSQAETA